MKRAWLLLISCVSLSACLFASEGDEQVEYVPDSRYEHFNQVTNRLYLVQMLLFHQEKIGEWNNREELRRFVCDYEELSDIDRIAYVTGWIINLDDFVEYRRGRNSYSVLPDPKIWNAVRASYQILDDLKETIS